MAIDLVCPHCAHCLMTDEPEAFMQKMGKMESCDNCGEQFEVKKNCFQKHLTPEQREKAMLMKAKTKALMEMEKEKSFQQKQSIKTNSVTAPLENKKCPYCAETVKFEAIKCRFCGETLAESGVAKERVYKQPSAQGSKSKTTAALLAFFLGGLGVHKFYLGQTMFGLLYLVFVWTLVPSILALIDFILLIIMSDDDFDNKYN